MTTVNAKITLAKELVLDGLKLGLEERIKKVESGEIVADYDGELRAMKEIHEEIVRALLMTLMAMGCEEGIAQ